DDGLNPNSGLGLFLLWGERSMRRIKHGLEETSEMKSNPPAKRVDIVSLKLVKESSMLYQRRTIRSPRDAYDLVQSFVEEADREHFLVVCLDVKNRPTSINVCHVGSLIASLAHPREVLKTAVLSNAASVLVAHNHPSGDPT